MTTASYSARSRESTQRSSVITWEISSNMKYIQTTNDQLNEVYITTSMPSDQISNKNCLTKMAIILTVFLLCAIIIITVVLCTVTSSVTHGTNTTRSNAYSNKTKHSHGEYNEIGRILQQMEELETLKCQPHKLKIQVNTTLEDDDELLSSDFYPQHVAVHRCLDVCSYCSGDARCKPVPAHEEEKQFLVAFLDERNITVFRTLVVTEHTECKCQ